MRENEFEAFGESPLFEKLFIFKGYHDFVTVHYLAKKLVKGPSDGTDPSKVAVPLKSLYLAPIERYAQIEQQLTA